jgi:hypothetical protein
VGGVGAAGEPRGANGWVVWVVLGLRVSPGGGGGVDSVGGVGAAGEPKNRWRGWAVSLA